MARVLLLRSAETIDGVRQALQAAGMHVISAPLIKTLGCRLEASIVRQVMEQCDVVCCLSKNAVRQLSLYQGQLQTNAQIWAVGGSTAKQLRRYFPEVFVPKVETSEGLWQALQHRVRPGDNVALLKGQGGREYLINKMGVAGADVRQINLYRRIELSKGISGLNDILQVSKPVSHIVVGSGNLLQLALFHWADMMKPAKLVVPSIRVAQIALNAGMNRIVVSNGASAKAVIAAIEDSRSVGG